MLEVYEVINFLSTLIIDLELDIVYNESKKFNDNTHSEIPISHNYGQVGIQYHKGG